MTIVDDALFRRLTSAPLGDGSARSAEWLAEITDACPGEAALLGDKAVRALLLGVHAGSTYLGPLAVRDSVRLVRILSCVPERRLDELVAAALDLAVAAPAMADLMTGLRQVKNEAALLIALADLGGAWPVATVTDALTRIADATVQSAVRWLFRQAAAKGDWLGGEPDAPDLDSGYIVLGMGKYGAFELNYSSDIDLIVFYETDKLRLRDGVAAAGIPGAADARPRQDHAGAHGGWLRVPRRPAAAPRPRRHPDRAVDGCGAQLLRELRPELGACGDDQGARRRRRYCDRAARSSPSSRRSSGASTSTSRQSPTSTP